MYITTILSIIVIILFVLYKTIEYLIIKKSFSLVHPIKGVMNGTKPFFIFGDLPIQNILNLKPHLKRLGDIYFRWFFWYPIVEIKDINAIQYVYNEKSSNYGLYWNLNKTNINILTGSEIKRFFRIYYCAFNCKDSLTRILPVVRNEVFKFTNSINFQNSILSTNKEVPNFMLKLLGRVYLGSGDEAYHCLKANYKKFNRTYMDFIHYLFPSLLKISSKFSKKYLKNKYKRSLYQVLAMKAYYGVVKQSKDDVVEDSIINIIAETSYNDKEGLSLEEMKMPSYLLNASSIKGPMIMIQSIMFMFMQNPEVESKIRKEIRLVLEKNGKTIDNFTIDDIHEMTYLEATLDEVNRLYPPFPKLLPRQTKESDRIMGYHIPKGTMISCPVADILRDPKLFENPCKFSPERQLKFSNPKFASPSITSIQQLNGLPSSSSNSFALHHRSLPSSLSTKFDISDSNSSSSSSSNSGIGNQFKRKTSEFTLDHGNHGNRIDQLKNDPLNISHGNDNNNLLPIPTTIPPYKSPLASKTILKSNNNNNNNGDTIINNHTISSSSSSSSSSTLNVPNIIEINKNNPINNNQYNSYNNLTIEERNERIVKNLPWGIGTKKCLGKELAKVIVKTIIIIFYSQYSFDKHIEDDEDNYHATTSKNSKPEIEMVFGPEIKPPLLFKSRKIMSSYSILSKQ